MNNSTRKSVRNGLPPFSILAMLLFLNVSFVPDYVHAVAPAGTYNPGAIDPTGQVLCEEETGVLIATIHSLSDASGSNDIHYKWQVSVNGGPFNDISGNHDAPTFRPTRFNAFGSYYIFKRLVQFERNGVWYESQNTYKLVVDRKNRYVSITNLTASATEVCKESPVTLSVQGTTNSQDVIRYQWSNGATGSSITVYPPTTTTYTVTASVSVGACAASTSESITVNVYPGFNAGAILSSSENSTDTICLNSPAPSIGSLIPASGGYGNIHYRWLVNGNVIAGATESTVSLGTTYSGVPGVYTFTREAKDETCVEWTTSDNEYVLVVSDVPSDAVVLTVPDVTICNGQSALLTASVEGQSAATWEWFLGTGSDIQPIDNATEAVYRTPNLSATTNYTVVAITTISTGGIHCSANASKEVTVTVLKPQVAIDNILAPEKICNGESVELSTVPIGTVIGDLSYQWYVGEEMNPDIQADQSYFQTPSLTSDSYFVVVATAVVSEEDIFCTASDTQNIFIAVPEPLKIEVVGTNVLCYGGFSGGATADVTGGYLDYNYKWSNGDETASISDLEAGLYTVTVTDTKGCVGEGSVVIQQPASELRIETISRTDVLCKDADNGSIAVRAYGGTLAAGHEYVYHWSNSATTSIIENLAPGQYVVTAFDDNNCEAFEMFTINEPEDLDVTAEVHDVSCYGRSDGRVYAYAIGGTAPYAYLWSGNMLSSNPYIEDIKGGTYSLLVTDGNGCSILKTIAVREPDSLSVQITSEKESCYGADGKISALATGGTSFQLGNENPYYLYSWYQENASSDWVFLDSNLTEMNTLKAGNYLVRVKDANGCEANETVALLLDNPLNINSEISFRPVICNGGSFSVVPERGVDGNIPDGTLYSWAAPVIEGVSGTVAGVDQSTIHDENIYYAGPESEIDIPYVVTAKFGNICSNSTNLVVSVNVSVYGNMSISLPNDTVCPNVGSQTLTAKLENVSRDYDIVWTFDGTSTERHYSSSEKNPSFTVQIPNDNCDVTYPYTVTIKDALNCQNSKSGNIVVRIPDWEIGMADVFETVACPSLAVVPFPPLVVDGCGDTLEAQPVGFDPRSIDPVICHGTVEYTYRYTACDNTSRDWTYTYYLKDTIVPVLEDCSDLDQTLISENCTFVVPDFENAVWPKATDNCMLVEYVQYPASGTIVTESTDVTVYVKDACDNESERQTIHLSVPASLALIEITSEHVDVACKEDASGSFHLTAVNGREPYLYSMRANMNTTGVFNRLESGKYTVVVSDANGCSTSAIIEILEPDETLSAIIPAPSAICLGDSSTLSVIVEGGRGKYQFQWTENDEAVVIGSADSIRVGPARTTSYRVVVTDSNGCSTSDSKTLLVHSVPVIMLNDKDGVCPTVGQTELTGVIVSETEAPYRYEWGGDIVITPNVLSGELSTSHTVLASIPVISDTVYRVYVEVTDNNACGSRAEATVSIKEAAYGMDDKTGYVRCNGGAFSVMPTGVEIPEGTQYVWNVDTSLSISGYSHQTTPTSAPISQALYNDDSTSQTLLYHVVPMTDGCPGDTFCITVDVEPTPTLTLDCPQDVHIDLDFGDCDFYVEPSVIGTPFWLHSLEWSNVVLSNDIPAGNIFHEGDNLITWKLTDECGNFKTCEQHITISLPACPDAVDYEGNVYHSVRINCDCWTQRNLESTLYSDGSPIPGVYNYYSDLYPNTSENVRIFGRLYDWQSAIKDGMEDNWGHIQGVCPKGWYLPTAEQYRALNAFGASALKSPLYWIDGGGDNSTGFTSLPGGYYDGSIGRYLNLMGEACYWSAWKSNGQWNAAAYSIQHSCDEVIEIETRAGLGYSVRCIKEIGN